MPEKTQQTCVYIADQAARLLRYHSAHNVCARSCRKDAPDQPDAEGRLLKMTSGSAISRLAPVPPPEKPRLTVDSAVSRRRVIALAGASAALPLVHIRGA